MPTLTVTTTRTGRGRSLSLIAPRPSPIFSIPNELVLDILELAILQCKTSAFRLAVVCKTISEFIDSILYRTIVLSSSEVIALFHRTVRFKPREFLQTHVKQISITCEPAMYKSNTASQLSHIVRACAPYALTAPSQHEPLLLCPQPYFTSRASLAHLIIESYIAGPPTTFSLPTTAAPFAASDSLTHLRVCEPSDVWASPFSILADFGALPNLTHLHLARRAGSNEDNDRIFVDEISAILLNRPDLKMLVVSVFSQEWLPASSVLESSVWQTLKEAGRMDKRLIIRTGSYGEWRNEWKGTAVAMRPIGPANFWRTCASDASVDVSMQ